MEMPSIKLDGTVSLGHLIAAILLVGGIVANWYAFDNRVSQLETTMPKIEAQLARLNETLIVTSNQSIQIRNNSEQIQEIRRELNKLSNFQD